MKRNILISLLICLFLGMNVFAQSINPNNDSLKGKKVLYIYGGWEGHEPVQCKNLLIPWLKSEGAEVILSDSLGIYTNEQIMNSIDLIIQSWTMGSLRAEEEAGLTKAVKNGVGLAGWHGGLCDSFRGSTEYQFMTGGQWVQHPGGVIDYDVNIRDHQDTVTKGLKDFHIHSEQYYVLVDPNVKVLATTTCRGDKISWIEGCVMPVVWKKNYGKGRIFYSSLAHVAKDFEIPEVLEIMKRGIRWAAQSKYEKTESLIHPMYK
ncbi:MAG: ThuA domain-containing protein [Phocaeicola sp.]|uniref:ThuA domain-containing protein n=1 Tax=Phocaeicola sp. TaxID=2773926 RepID=UPI003F9F9941